MYEITGSALSLGLVGLVQFTSLVLFMLVAGHAADRYDRRFIVVVTQVVQFGLAVVLAAGSHGDWLTSHVIYGCAFLLGTTQAFQSPTLRALLPGLVDRGVFTRAIAWTSASKKAAVILGPALGGVIYMIAAAAVYAASAAFFAVAIALFAGVHASVRTPNPEPVTLKSIFGGIEYIRRHPVVLGAISLDLFATLLGGATALLPIYARDILGTGPWGLGLLRSAPALGALGMSLIVARRSLGRRVGRTMFRAVIAFGAATIVFAASRWLPLSFVALCVLGAADVVSVVIRLTLVQLTTPDAMRGRVSAVSSLFTGTSNQLGDFRAGVMAGLLGAVPAVMLGGIGTVDVALLWMRWFPELRRVDRLDGRSVA
jgi:MFS family permease